MKRERDRVLLIVLDAAEPRLIEQWSGDGTLPHLQRLKEQGTYGRLDSSADWLAGSPWPTFYTGTPPDEHGVYHFLQWQAERMTCVRPVEKGRPQPFWRTLSEAGRTTVALDLPMTFPPQPFSGVELSGWSTHDRFAPPSSYPADRLRQVRREFGPSPIGEENYGTETARDLLGLRDELIHATAKVAEAGRALMRREPWDLFMLGFGATHRGGHKLWDASGLSESPDAGTRKQLDAALRDVYVACDRAIGELVANAPDNCTLLVGSLHGMGPNTTRSAVLPLMLERILEEPREVVGQGDEAITGSETNEDSGGRGLKDLLPESWRLAIKRRLPMTWQDRLTTSYFMGPIDWPTTPAFCLIADLQGYIRINVRGREARGIVSPGAEYDELCDRIASGIATFCDADTGEPIVHSVKRADRLFPGGARLMDLPDILVRWARTEAAQHREIVSPQYGSVAWPCPGINPDGRSGNHRPEGFLLAAGDGIEPGSEFIDGDIRDLAPTIFRLLDVSPDLPPLQGVPIPAVTA